MKRLRFLFPIFILLSLFLFEGCGVLRQYVEIGVRTNLPVHSNMVVITCPQKLFKEVIGKIDFEINSQFANVVVVGDSRPTYLKRFYIKPGIRATVYAGGTFGNIDAALIGFVYNTKNQLIGRVSTIVNFSNTDSFKSNIKIWNITERDIRFTEGYGLFY